MDECKPLPPRKLHDVVREDESERVCLVLDRLPHPHEEEPGVTRTLKTDQLTALALEGRFQ